jgi:hypothetical protein
MSVETWLAHYASVDGSGLGVIITSIEGQVERDVNNLQLPGMHGR